MLALRSSRSSSAQAGGDMGVRTEMITSAVPRLVAASVQPSVTSIQQPHRENLMRILPDLGPFSRRRFRLRSLRKYHTGSAGSGVDHEARAGCHHRAGKVADDVDPLIASVFRLVERGVRIAWPAPEESTAGKGAAPDETQETMNQDEPPSLSRRDEPAGSFIFSCVISVLKYTLVAGSGVVKRKHYKSLPLRSRSAMLK